MKLADLSAETEESTLDAVHVYATATGPDRFMAHIGNNVFAIRRGAEFADAVAVNDVLQVSLAETGVYEATSKLGTRPAATTEYATYGLPWDFQQVGWDGGSSTFYSAVSVLPAALIRTDDDRTDRVRYGHVGGGDRYTDVFYGQSARWAYPTLGDEPAQKLSLLLLEPNPVPLKLTLLGAHYPGESLGTVDVPVTPSLDYYGPTVPNVVDLPTNWVDALADGSAGAIRFGPAGSTVGLTDIAIGIHRSLSLHT